MVPFATPAYRAISSIVVLLYPQRNINSAAASRILSPRCSRFERSSICPCSPLRWLANRSEEHTSELQSHLNLVCRLLLEKKKLTLTNKLTSSIALTLSV